MSEMNEQAVQDLVTGVLDTVFKGGTIRDVKGISDEEMESLYAIAYNFYTTGKFDEADQMFRYLVYIDHTNRKFWMGLGAVQQVRGEYSKAVTSYGYASFLDMDDPKPQYHAAECFIELGDLSSAESALAALDRFAPPASPYREKAKKLAARIANATKKM